MLSCGQCVSKSMVSLITRISEIGRVDRPISETPPQKSPHSLISLQKEFSPPTFTVAQQRLYLLITSHL